MFGGVPSAGRWLPGGKADTSAPFHVIGKLAHGFLRDDASFAPGKRSFRFIDRGKRFRACALTLFPQGKGFLHRVFFAQQPSALDSLADKRSLAGSVLYFHALLALG
jgi:hypothetical protein